MRVTNSMLVSNFMNNLNNSTNKLSKLQNQLATNRKYAHISEDPVSVIYSQQARFKLHKLAQYQANVDMAQSWLTQTETSLMELNEVLQAAYESCIDATTDVKGESDRAIMSKYMGQLRDQVLTLLNSTFGDKYVFGGYNSTGVVDGDGTLRTPFEYITTVDFSGVDFSSAESTINDVLSSGELSITYTPPDQSLVVSNDSSSEVKFTYSLDGDGVLSVIATDGTNSVTQTVSLNDINTAGAPVELDFGDFGKVTLENTDTSNPLEIKESYDITLPLDSASVQSVIDTALSSLASGIESTAYSSNPPTLTLTFAGDGEYKYTSDTDGGNAGDLQVGYTVTDDGKLKLYVQTPSGATVESNEEWAIDLTDGGSGFMTFNVEGFGAITLGYTNGSPAPVAASAAGGGSEALDLTAEVTSEKSVPIEEQKATSAFSNRKLTYNGIDLMTTDPDERAILDKIIGQVTQFDIGPGVQMQISENGGNVMVFGEPPNQINIYNLMDQLTNALANGASVEEINKFIKPLQDAQNHILSVVADVGGRYSRLELVASRYEQDFLNYVQMQSDAEDADQAEIIMNYKMAEAVYQAALATGAYIIQPTLMDFLR